MTVFLIALLAFWASYVSRDRLTRARRDTRRRSFHRER
jgi:hypothetical protein